MATGSRSVERSISIDAPIERVWRALTDADEIRNWFAPDVTVVPGKGGSITMSWGGQWEWPTKIEAWDPPRYLRLLQHDIPTYDINGNPSTEGERAQIAIDYHLESRGGQTVLRLVHSGFGAGAGWDDELDGVERGWALELGGLKFYLERHPGTPRTSAWVRSVSSQPAPEAWSRAWSSAGLVKQGILGAAPGSRFSLTLATGDHFDGQVFYVHPSMGWVGVAEDWNDALLRVWLDRVGSEVSVNLWLSTYGVDASRVESFRERTQQMLDALFTPFDAAQSKSFNTAPGRAFDAASQD